jgi:hypothetical protein
MPSNSDLIKNIKPNIYIYIKTKKEKEMGWLPTLGGGGLEVAPAPAPRAEG